MFLNWVAGRWAVDRTSDKLVNDKHNKYSMYHWFGNSGLLQNGLLLKVIRYLFDRNEGVNNVVDPHASFHGIQTHENGVFLYQSKEAQQAVKAGYADYTILGSAALYLAGAKIFFLPMLVATLYVPRRWTQLYYFTWHAELLPHSE